MEVTVHLETWGRVVVMVKIGAALLAQKGEALGGSLVVVRYVSAE
jgi:hypothetical protein